MVNDIEVGKLIRENEILGIIGKHLTGGGYYATQINEELIKIIKEIKNEKK